MSALEVRRGSRRSPVRDGDATEERPVDAPTFLSVDRPTGWTPGLLDAGSSAFPVVPAPFPTAGGGMERTLRAAVGKVPAGGALRMTRGGAVSFLCGGRTDRTSPVGLVDAPAWTIRY